MYVRLNDLIFIFLDCAHRKIYVKCQVNKSYSSVLLQPVITDKAYTGLEGSIWRSCIRHFASVRLFVQPYSSPNIA